MRARIGAAAYKAKRDASSIRLVLASKTQPSEAIRAACEAGARDFGENYVQEAIAKRAELADLTEIRWHLIGHLQTNKANAAANAFALIHSVDSTAWLKRSRARNRSAADARAYRSESRRRADQDRRRARRGRSDARRRARQNRNRRPDDDSAARSQTPKRRVRTSRGCARCAISLRYNRACAKRAFDGNDATTSRWRSKRARPSCASDARSSASAKNEEARIHRRRQHGRGAGPRTYPAQSLQARRHYRLRRCARAAPQTRAIAQGRDHRRQSPKLSASRRAAARRQAANHRRGDGGNRGRARQGRAKTQPARASCSSRSPPASRSSG